MNDINDCIISEWEVPDDMHTTSTSCLSTNADYQGQQEVQLANGKTVTADVYELFAGGNKITKYFELDDTNCIPIGEKWLMSPGEYYKTSTNLFVET